MKGITRMRVNLNTNIYSITHRQNNTNPAFGSYNDPKPVPGWKAPKVTYDGFSLSDNYDKGTKLFSAYLKKNVRIWNPYKDSVYLTSDTVTGSTPQPKGIKGQLIEMSFSKKDPKYHGICKKGESKVGAYIDLNDSPQRISEQCYGMFKSLCKIENRSVEYRAENGNWFSM